MYIHTLFPNNAIILLNKTKLPIFKVYPVYLVICMHYLVTFWLFQSLILLRINSIYSRLPGARLSYITNSESVVSLIIELCSQELNKLQISEATKTASKELMEAQWNCSAIVLLASIRTCQMLFRNVFLFT